MKSLRGSVGMNMACGVVAVLLLGLGPAFASAQSVRGHGEFLDAPNLPSQISVDAWQDDDGIAHGSIVWVGGFVPGSLPKTGHADPWFIDVMDIAFDGNIAYVSGVVSHSVFPADIGTPVLFAFTDNSGTDEPDEIDILSNGVGGPFVAGNITVDD